MFLIDDNQTQISEVEVLLEQSMRADNNVNFAFSDCAHQRGVGSGGFKTRKTPKVHRVVRKSFAKDIVVLIGQQGRWCQDRDLVTTVSHDKSGA